MRPARILLCSFALLFFAGSAAADVADPILVVGGDPVGPPIGIFTTSFTFSVNLTSCGSLGCDDLFQNDTGHTIKSLILNYGPGGLTCLLGNGTNGAPAQSFFTTCILGPSGTNGVTMVTFTGGPGIPSATCSDTDDDGDSGSGCNKDDTWSGGEFSIDFDGFPLSSSVDFSGTASANSTVPEPATFSLIVIGTGSLLAGRKRRATK